MRREDVSGVSGVGLVAEGVVFTGGSVSLHWFGEHESIVVRQSIESVIAVHGHAGRTYLKWID